ncbi:MULTISPECIES: LysM peptidoglycan-binding domain-containing protein [unclassified Microbacterium]|uniref:LysM peptidoglycan-binding domain-containing protein n=1 Tax=unclassified Microbacterium TaxID=2609290 RepID=UPI00366026BD
MSSITFAGQVPATRLRITARGRRVLAALVALPVAGAIAFAALSSGSALASGEQTTGNTFATVTVQPGDTLWSIAGEIAPNADPRDVVAEISKLNLVDGGVIEVGQHLAIPAQYGSAGR